MGKRGADMCQMDENGGGVAHAVVGDVPDPPSPHAFPHCPLSGHQPVCSCAAPSYMSRGDKVPCVCPAGTDCTKSFSGCTYCAYQSCIPFMQQGSSICSCTSGSLPPGSAPVECACGEENCFREFSGCS